MRVLLCLLIVGWLSRGATADEPLSRDAAVEAMHRAVTFFRTRASAGGGYVYRLSDDLQRREGEGMVGATTAWIEPPGTPAVGTAYLEAWQLTGDELLKVATLETAAALVQTQLESGAWDDRIEFAVPDRAKYAYRVDQPADLAGLKNVTTFDDDKSQSALRFLMSLDESLRFEDATIHEAAQYALEAFLKAQYPNGAWPQRYSEFPDVSQFPVKAASYPDEWPREYPGGKYFAFYTLNDDTISDLIATLFLAYDIYGDPRFFEAAQSGADFLVLAQMPEPQPGWAQQYDLEMHPVWARKFEPPAITGGESQGVMRTLIEVYRRTGDRKYLTPIPKAIAYFRSSLLPDGTLARFYELKTNRPLYCTHDYKLTFEANDLPTHYSFISGSGLDGIETEYRRALTETSPRRPDRALRRPEMTEGLRREAEEAVRTLDARGAWVTDGRLRYWPDDPGRRVIESAVFARNLERLARFVAARTE